MISASPLAQDSRTRLTVDESRIQHRSWHVVDLGTLRAQLARGTAQPLPVQATLGARRHGQPVSRAGSRATAAASIPIARRLKRVPDSAFVTIGRAERASSLPASANDNAARPSSKRIRFALRDAVMLAILAATVAGAFYSGRLHAAQTVIVVPGPSSARNAIT
jgi:hypothetical protein